MATPGLAARKQLLDLFGKQVEREAQIDFDAPDDVFCTQLADHGAECEREEPLIEAARRRIRRADALGQRQVRRQLEPVRPLRSHSHGREPGRRSVRAGPKRARAPSRLGDDDPEPAPKPQPLTNLAASVRMWAHERRRLARRRYA